MDPSLTGWIIAVVAFGITVFLALARRGSGSDQGLRLARIERQLKLIMDNMGIVEPRPEMPEVVAHLDQGRKIQAIKAYRETTGAGLAAAKSAVEAMARERGL